jgi:Cd2+/Zn2+-exporting ATPase
MENHEHVHSKNAAPSSGSTSLSPIKPGDLESTYRISGADCSDEVVAIEKALSKIGLNDVSVNLVAATVTVHHSAATDDLKIRSAIESTGVKIVGEEDLSFWVANQKRIAVVVSSGILLIFGLFLQWYGHSNDAILIVVFGLATLLAGILVFPKAFRALRQKTLDMNVLMSVAVIGAFAVREYSEAATVVFLFSLAELLETFSVDRARQAIKAVLKLTPQIAQVKQGEKIVSLPVTQVKAGDYIVVRPGDSIPLDGLVTEGRSSVNQAPLTGESLPVEKVPGDQVFAGTINESGAFTLQVTKAFRDTKISRVIKLIEEAQEQKAPSERFVDRFAKIYTPVVFLLAIGVAAVPPLFLSQSFDIWFYRALVLLVIACPCALVLSTPISVVSGLASLARLGVLVKGGKHLEALGKIQAVALDKTGTLTEGKFSVQSFRGFNGAVENEVLRLAVSLEALSTHPLAKAVLTYGKDAEVEPVKVERYSLIPGRGAEGEIGSQVYFVGNHRLTHELGICTPEIEDYLSEIQSKGLSVIVVGQKTQETKPGKVLGILGLGDTVKANAKTAILALHKAGIKKVVVLSGDSQQTVDQICRLTGVDQGIGELLPEGKVEHIKKMTVLYRDVAMVGDGVNDAPAMASATIGISMGAAGTDTAIETSDVSLMQDDLSQLPRAIAQGRRVLGVIRFNIAFAISIKAVFLVLAVAGISNLWLAVAADMGASMVVTLNALRLLGKVGK